MNERLLAETERLRRSWDRHDAGMLRDYLVAGVEDPRLNVQSILSRHFVADALLGDRFAALRDHELRFAVVLHWLREWLKLRPGLEEFAALRHALRRGSDNAEGLEIPRFVGETYAALPASVDGGEVPNYLDAALRAEETARGQVPAEALATFQRLWSAALREVSPTGLSLVEPACGSANDYRFLEGFGLARLVTYTGFDLCERNVANARGLFPTARFEVGNALEIEAPAKAFDLCLVHDLFEHLSPEALEVALAEVGRVTRRGLCLGFFNMHEDPEPVVRPVEDYHWNTLSLPAVRSRLEREGFRIQAVHIGTFLKWRFGCRETHNDQAYTLIGRAAASPAPV